MFVQWYEITVLIRIWQPNRGKVEGVKEEEEDFETNQSRHDVMRTWVEPLWSGWGRRSESRGHCREDS